ncbi:MAG: hypothetical protein Q8R05_07075 [Candidatus Omnitrophota bacterium]|nr:hypothetical protein [Candidatus Omnitrophota bacterium]
MIVLPSVLIPVSSEARNREDTVDLGETGFTSPIQFRGIDKEMPTHGMFEGVSRKINIQPIKFSYKSAIPKHYGLPITRYLSFRKNLSLPIGAKIFVFSCYDEDSIKIASAVNFDYGLCIDYKSMDDVRDFKERAGIKRPVQIADDEMIKALGITSYPALVTVHNDELEIQEGF